MRAHLFTKANATLNVRVEPLTIQEYAKLIPVFLMISAIDAHVAPLLIC